ncbi:hypothetical protein LINPERPRIM_LOCUS21283 [Linum perenne]
MSMDLNTSENPLEKIFRNYFTRPPNVDSLIWLAQSTICTRSGGIFQQLRHNNSYAVFIDLHWCSRRVWDTTLGCILWHDGVSKRHRYFRPILCFSSGGEWVHPTTQVQDE